MNVGTLTDILKMQPFQPILIRTADGESYRIVHPELVAFAGRVMLLIDPRGVSYWLISLNMITAVGAEGGPPRFSDRLENRPPEEQPG